MSAPKGRLAGKIALITGAGSGVGNAVTKLFAAEGARVAAIARRPDNLEDLSRIENVFAIKADITKLEDIHRMVDEAEERVGDIDILCNIAGIHDLLYPLDETSDEMWDAVMNTNLKAPFQISRRVIKSMIKRRQGVILNTSSLAAFRGLHGPSYSASKAGLVGMTISTAVKYAPLGIRCNAMSLGPVKTNITEKSGGNVHVAGMEYIKTYAARLPVKWVCDPEDIAPTALFLCSDEAKHINGAIVPVDGGMSGC